MEWITLVKDSTRLTTNHRNVLFMTIRLLHLAVTIFVSQTFASHIWAYCFEIMHFFQKNGTGQY